MIHLPSEVAPGVTYYEVMHSETAERHAIDNSLPIELIDNVTYAAQRMVIVRAILAKRVYVSSWYRCLALNTFLGSKPTSDHVKGLAIDFACPGYGSPIEICKELIKHADELNYKQLILEHTWVHISFNAIPTALAKKEVLSLLASGGYASGLTDKFGKLLT